MPHQDDGRPLLLSVYVYVSLGHGWALAMVLRDNFTLEGVALPLLKLYQRGGEV